MKPSDLLTKKRCFPVYEHATDRKGEPCDPCSPKATAWSIDGAMLCAANNHWEIYQAIVKALEEVFASKGLNKTWKDWMEWEEFPTRAGADVIDLMLHAEMGFEGSGNQWRRKTYTHREGWESKPLRTLKREQKEARAVI